MNVGNREKRCWEEEPVNVGNREKRCWEEEPVNGVIVWLAVT